MVNSVLEVQNNDSKDKCMYQSTKVFVINEYHRLDHVLIMNM